MIDVDYFAFYGSLRRGMTNYEYYKPFLQHIETRRIPGFCLYALEGYPCAIRSREPHHSIVVEVCKVLTESAKDSIHLLELNAGYIFETIEINGREAGIYLFENPGNNIQVEGGDWVEFFGGETK